MNMMNKLRVTMSLFVMLLVAQQVSAQSWPEIRAQKAQLFAEQCNGDTRPENTIGLLWRFMARHGGGND